jgi:ribosome-associated translation inhibitor RaiA
MRAVFFHPLGPTVLIASLLLAGATRFLPGLDRWSAQAPWILFWGILGYTASVVALLWSRPEALSARSELVEADLSEAAINRWLRSEAAQHPSTLLSVCVAVASAGYLLLLAPAVGGGLWAAVVLALSGAAAAGSFLWRHTFRYAERYATRVQELMAILQRERVRLEQEELDGLRERLSVGFAAVGSVQGTKTLRDLHEEYAQLQPLLVRRDTDPLAIADAPALARETYRRGLGVLADVLELMRAARGPNRERLRDEIAELAREIKSLKGEESQRARVEVREERLASHRQRLGVLDQLQVHVDQLLYQAERCEASLHRARVEIAAIRAGASATGVDSVIEALQETIRRAKEVHEEMRRLGL